MSEEMRRAVGTILEAGFQMESEAFKTLVEKGREDSLKPLVDEVLKMASSAQPRPLVNHLVAVTIALNRMCEISVDISDLTITR